LGRQLERVGVKDGSTSGSQSRSCGPRQQPTQITFSEVQDGRVGRNTVGVQYKRWISRSRLAFQVSDEGPNKAAK
ncbi:unnamed protein product, partial [Ectocarpus sp. 12 AP-2014]